MEYLTIGRHMTTRGQPQNSAKRCSITAVRRRLSASLYWTKNARLPCSHSNIEVITPY